jgi:hypothetical protein
LRKTISIDYEDEEEWYEDEEELETYTITTCSRSAPYDKMIGINDQDFLNLKKRRIESSFYSANNNFYLIH